MESRFAAPKFSGQSNDPADLPIHVHVDMELREDVNVLLRNPLVRIRRRRERSGLESVDVMSRDGIVVC